MAAVYLGTQETFGRKVAIKILAPKTIADEEFATRFLREAKTVAQLAHSNIIPVYDFGEVGGYYYMSMEYLPGGTLATLLKTGIELDEALHIMEDVASALHFAHSKGIIHRDVKPENIMFREDHSAVLMDFGIAKRKDATDGVTVAGAVMGTPKYMSPEQIQGHELDGRCDIYALGILFYEMLMKDVPYKSEDFMALAMKHLKDPIPKLAMSFSRAQHFFERMVAKNPEERFQSGEEVARAARQLRETGKFDSSVKVSTQGVKQNAQVASVGDTMSRGMLNPQKKSAVKQGIWEGETKIKESFFGDKYQYHCRIVSEDFNRFSFAFTTFSENLMGWSQKRKGACDSIVLDLSVPSGDEIRVRTALRNLFKRDSHKFLQKVPMDVKLVFLDTMESRQFRAKP